MDESVSATAHVATAALAFHSLVGAVILAALVIVAQAAGVPPFTYALDDSPLEIKSLPGEKMTEVCRHSTIPAKTLTKVMRRRSPRAKSFTTRIAKRAICRTVAAASDQA